MTYLFAALAIVNLVVAGFTGNLANLAAGSSLTLLAVVWACNETDEAELDTDA